MVYRLKGVRYQRSERWILLQNENGPCPLLAAANALLLKGSCKLPPASVRNGVASLQDVTNMLAEQAMNAVSDHDASHAAVYVDELVKYIPKFQYGMDVNPCFTQGVTGYEFTAQLTAFDMLRCRLVHGWLVDIADEETFKALGTKTYNELVERVIHAKEAEAEIQKLQEQISELKKETTNEQQQPQAAAALAAAPVDLLDDAPPPSSSPAPEEPTLPSSKELMELETKLSELQTTSHDAILVEHFFESTGHQLTHYGLLQLQEHVKEDELCVFFRNNHFGTLTKCHGHLYLLVTDLGYANSPAVVWERIDVIDGDTDYVNGDFEASGTQAKLLASGPTLTPEQMMAASSQNEADYHLALHLSMQSGEAGQATAQGGDGIAASSSLDDQEGKILAAATEASLREYHGLNSTTAAGTTPGAPAAEETKGQQLPGRVEVGVPVAPSVLSSASSSNVSNHGKASGGAGAGGVSGGSDSASAGGSTTMTQEQRDHMLAMQLQGNMQDHDSATRASLHLAQQLQAEENQRATESNRRRTQLRQQQQQQQGTRAGGSRQSSSSSSCAIS